MIIVHYRRLGLPVESAAGDVEKVHRALARGLFINAVRLESTSYDMYDSARMGAHAYALVRSGGQGEQRLFPRDAQPVKQECEWLGRTNMLGTSCPVVLGMHGM